MRLRSGTLALLAGVLLLSFLGVVVNAAPGFEGFIRAQDGKFVNKDCGEVLLSGWNGWKVMEAGANDPGSLTRMLDTAQDAQFNTVRYFAHGSDPDFVLQPAPGVYNEAAFQGLDRAIAEAGSRGIKSLLSLSNMWKAPDGKKQFVSWVPSAGNCDIESCYAGGRRDSDDDEFACFENSCPDEDVFWTNPEVRELYKAHIETMATRVNSVTGVMYRDDPNIIGWNVMNEPVCRRETRNGGDGTACVAEVDAWISEMSAKLKSVAPNQLITVGQEGYYGPEETAERRAVNPMPDVTGDPLWAQKSGQSFLKNHAHESIDFAAVHIWVDNWKVPELGFQQRWIDQHVIDAGSLGKPFIIEEFGKVADRSQGNIESMRDPFFAQVYNAVKASMNSGAPLKGALFWEWENEGGNSERGVRMTDSTWAMVQENADLVAENNRNPPPVGQCVPGADRSYKAQEAAGRTWLSRGRGLVVGGAGGETVEASSLEDCAAACGAGCRAFTLASDSCTLLSDPSATDWTFVNGQETFWKLTPGNAEELGAIADTAAAETEAEADVEVDGDAVDGVEDGDVMAEDEDMGGEEVDGPADVANGDGGPPVDGVLAARVDSMEEAEPPVVATEGLK